MIRFVVFIVAFLCSSLLLAQDSLKVLYLVDGTRVKCKIIEYDPANQIKIMRTDSLIFIYPTKNIKKIENYYADVDGENTVNPNVFKYYYAEAGISFIHPGGINLALGGWIDKFGVRACGGYIPGYTSGFQIDLAYAFKQNRFTRQSFNIVCAYMLVKDEEDDSTSPNNYNYKKSFGIGPAYNLNYYGLHLEAGILYGTSNFNAHYFAFFQFGYLFNFNDF